MILEPSKRTGHERRGIYKSMQSISDQGSRADRPVQCLSNASDGVLSQIPGIVGFLGVRGIRSWNFSNFMFSFLLSVKK